MSGRSRATLVSNIAFYDLRITVKDKSTLFWTFVMPFVFIFAFGQIGGGADPSSFRATITLDDRDGGPVGNALVETLRRENINLVDSLPPGRDPVRTLVIPEGFSEKVFSREATSVYLMREEGSNIEAGETASVAIIRGIVRTVSSLLVIEKDLVDEGTPWLSIEEDSLLGNLQVVIDNVPGSALDMETRLDSLMAMEQVVRVETRLAGRAEIPPGGFQNSVPGTLVMFVLMTMAFSGVGLTLEKKSGVLLRIGMSPASRGDIVWGKLLGRMALSSLQILLLLLAGRFLFGISLGGDVYALTLLMLSFAFCAGGFSLLFGSLFEDADQMSGFAVITVLAMSALGGCWWPLEIVPGWARTIAFLLPTGWTMDGIHKLISFGYGLDSVTWHITALVAFGIAFLAVAAWRLRFE